MSARGGAADLLTLEPLLEAVRTGVEDAGWLLSGLQKTTSHEFERKWAGESTRSAYLFFHRADLPESVGMEAFLDETSDGLRGNLALVLDGPPLGRLGGVSAVLERVAGATGETLPEGYRSPVALASRFQTVSHRRTRPRFSFGSSSPSPGRRCARVRLRSRLSRRRLWRRSRPFSSDQRWQRCYRP